MFKYFLCLCISFMCATAHAGFDHCKDQFANGEPPTVQNPKLLSQSQEFCYNGFAVLYSGVSKTPIYSAQYYQPQDDQHAIRVNKFHGETLLPTAERVVPGDYVGTGYDRGHATPYANMNNAKQRYDSFVMTNIFPQAPKNNQGVWRMLEEKVRMDLNQTDQSAYIITGVIFNGQVIKSIHGILVPTHIYKVVYIPSTNTAQAYLSENRNDAKVQEVALADVEQLVQIHFFEHAVN